MRLEVTKGPAAGRWFEFDKPDVFIFGRGEDAHFSLNSDGAISRSHFMLRINPPDCSLMDLNSSNGTSVNDVFYCIHREKTEKGFSWKPPCAVGIRDGDRLKAGKSHFRVGIFYDLICDACGAKFVVRGDAEYRTMGAVPLCEECRSTASPGKDTTAIRCARCGSEVGSEVGPRATSGGVEYVCRRCRNSTIHNKEVGEALRALEGPRGRAVAVDCGGAPPPPGIPGYEYLGLVKVGGMGAVYLARSLETGERVAVKTMLPEVAVKDDSAAMFEREIEVASSLRHPHIVATHAHGHIGPVFYCVMDYVDGIDADGLMGLRGPRVPVDEAVHVMRQALDGLAHAHERAIVHRDFKPDNVLLERRGASWHARVADFGLAKNFDEAGLSGLTMEGTYAGSWWFMPREQIIRYRWVKPTTDVYAAGATLYYLLTGVPVRRGLETAADMPTTMNVILNEPVVPVRERDPSIPEGLASVIDAAIRDEESRRYHDAGMMLAALGGPVD
ncbi:MAG: protein kinase domain-containing protein [Planctomycetota bacterium]|jgi:serine/threonine-protein kinase